MTKQGQENDIAGAFGTIRATDNESRRGFKARLLTLLAIVGPGLIVMVGDNDAGGISTYAQAGQNFGYSLLWTLPLLIPVLMVNQEMVARLGAVSGLGHGRLIRERLGRRWGNLATGSILFLNFLILITEFIGISLSTSYFGAPAYITVPLAAVLLFTVTAAGTFRSWERLMMLFVAVNVLIVPLLLVTNASGHSTMHGLTMPSIRGGATSGGILLIISIIGTTVAPWQLFFQQSNIVDKRITPRWLNYERVDTLLGSIIVVVSASAIIVAAAAGLSPHGDTSSYTDALGVAQGFARYVGHGSGAMFAILLLNASIIGAAAVTLASSYAFGDLTGSRQGLDSRLSEAKGFYGAFAALLAVASVVTLLPGAPLGIITLAVQAMCGLMLPSTTIFVLMLANDREVLGPWTNTRWMNAIATVVIGALIALSITLMVSTLFPSVNVMRLLVDLSVVVGCVLAILVPWTFIHTGPAPTYDIKRADWRMPRLALVTPLPMSRGRRFLLRSVAVYLAVAGVMLVWRMIQLGVHQ
ncbi:unannotated protein [freshwater metagenome]|uniref:Unannotated protein n=1 Tax=freshwater metagenome TaxID=449393 RepID=A0A6J7E9K9_9ZZZZ|nr:divalent metal cation transporter [Actinomycetota bacterium]MUH58661.1 manganese transporter [Actinomycetota bacterium]